MRREPGRSPFLNMPGYEQIKGKNFYWTISAQGIIQSCESSLLVCEDSGNTVNDFFFVFLEIGKADVVRPPDIRRPKRTAPYLR